MVFGGFGCSVEVHWLAGLKRTGCIGERAPHVALEICVRHAHVFDIALLNIGNKLRSIQSPDTLHRYSPDGRLGLIKLQERIPVLEPDVFEKIVRVLSMPAGVRPKIEQRERDFAAALSHMNHVRITQSEITAVEDLLWPADTDNIRDARRKHALLDEYVRYIFSGCSKFFFAVSEPVAV